MSQFLLTNKNDIEASLLELLNGYGWSCQQLADAVRYSVCGGGKRLRAVICLAVGQQLGAKPEDLLHLARAIELLHASSLVHDDLPALDNDDLRRGRPATHIAFGEGVAVLAGDSLLSLAFRELSFVESLKQGALLRLFAETSQAICEGQVFDILTDGRLAAFGGGGEEELFQGTIDDLILLTTLKTARLFQCTIEGAVLLSPGVTKDAQALASELGLNLGLGFQILDDLLDCYAPQEEIGKPVGSDAARGKYSYATVQTREEGIEQAIRYLDSAQDCLARLLPDDMIISNIIGGLRIKLASV